MRKLRIAFIKNKIPAIVDVQTWEKVRRRMSNNKHNAKNTATHNYPLSGLIVCGDCGAKYVGCAKTNKRGTVTRYYVCGNRYRTQTCKNMNYNADILEADVKIHIQSWADRFDVDELAKEIADEYNKTLKVDKTELRKEIEELDRKIKRAGEILMKDDFPIIRETMLDAYKRKSEIEAVLNTEKGEPVNADELAQTLRKDFANIGNLSYEELLQRYIDKIIATGKDFSILGCFKSGSPEQTRLEPLCFCQRCSRFCRNKIAKGQVRRQVNLPFCLPSQSPPSCILILLSVMFYGVILNSDNISFWVSLLGSQV